MKIKADFHIHTHHSKDSGASASAILDAARKAGLDVIGITDHKTTKGALEVRSIAKGRPFTSRGGGKLLVLVGQEVRTMSGEIIVFGPEKDMPSKLRLKDACAMAKAMGGFVVVPHPFDITRHGVGKDMFSAMDYIDAIEVLNARCLPNRFNRKALEFAQEHEFPVVSGSDAHFPDEIGGCFTELEINGKLTEKAVFEAVASGRTKISGRRSGVVPHIKTALHKTGVLF